MRKLLKWLDSIEAILVILCSAGIVLLVFGGVLSRFLFHYSIAWSEELARYLFLWGALFGGSAACRYGQHGGIPLVVDKLPQKWQKIIEFLIPLGMAIFLLTMAWQSYLGAAQAYVSGQTSSTTGIPVSLVNGIAALAFLMAAFRTIQGYFEHAYRVDEVEIQE